jgi:hypothetical protein
MKIGKALTSGYLIFFTAIMGSCTKQERTPIAGRYYTAPTEDGDERLYFDDPQLGPTELCAPSVVGMAKGYVASCDDSCYLFPIAAATAEAARRSQLGPFTEAECKQKVFQLTADSLQLRSLYNTY